MAPKVCTEMPHGMISPSLPGGALASRARRGRIHWAAHKVLRLARPPARFQSSRWSVAVVHFASRGSISRPTRPSQATMVSTKSGL